MNEGGGGLRVIVCTKRDLAGALVLNQVLPHLIGDQVLVLLSDKTRPVENAVPELAEMKFLERELPVETLFPLIDAAGGAGGRLATFEGAARRFNVPVEIVTDINGPAGEDLVRAFKPDIIVSARFSLIFKSNIFEIPRFGTYNIHPGALPHYAGLFAPFRCMVEGGDRIGCTLHRVDQGIDTGPIVGIGWLPIDPQRSLLWHVVRTYRPGLELFFEMLHGLRAGREPEPIAQDRAQRRYGSLPCVDAFKEFSRRGFRLYQPEDYLDILRSFVAPEMRAQMETIAGVADEGVGAPCCCARA
jgi:methionyl-tRNA formyltransferase